MAETLTYLKLVRGERYNRDGELFQRGFIYKISDPAKAKKLLRAKDDVGISFFATTRAPVEVEDEIEEETDTETQTVAIKRKRGRPRKSTKVRTAGDTGSLDVEDSSPTVIVDDDEDGIEV